MARGDLLTLDDDTALVVLTVDRLDATPVLTGVLATRTEAGHTPTGWTVVAGPGSVWQVHPQQVHTIDRRAAGPVVAACPTTVLDAVTATVAMTLALHRP